MGLGYLAVVGLLAGGLVLGAPPASGGPTQEGSSTSPRTSQAAVPPGPDFVRRPISFGKARKRQMARYSKRHYGVRGWRLDPRAIVQHYTATNSLSSVFATFESNAPDPELSELPGTCTHFVIDRDGTIYRLVKTKIRCRHTVGLNHVAIGIEHVGTSDDAVMSNRRQRRASLALTAWLMHKFDIPVGDVIGHNESLESRFRTELYAAWRCQTHGDFVRSTMRDYRRRLKARADRWALDASGPRWKSNGCR